MKKALVVSILMIVFLISYFVQSNFFTWFTIAGIRPNLIIILVLCIGLYAGKTLGSILGIIFGLLLDIFIGKNIGISSILLGIVGFLGGYLDKNFSKDSKITIILMCIGATFFYEIVKYLIYVVMYQMELEIIALLKIVTIEALFNSFLIIIFYPITIYAGYRIEEIFKGKNILTRYF